MKIWHHDRYYINKMQNKRPTILEFIAFYLHAAYTVKNGSPGQLNLLWLQLHDLKSKILILLIDRKKNFLEYFDKDHPFNNVKDFRDV